MENDGTWITPDDQTNSKAPAMTVRYQEEIDGSVSVRGVVHLQSWDGKEKDKHPRYPLDLVADCTERVLFLIMQLPGVAIDNIYSQEASRDPTQRNVENSSVSHVVKCDRLNFLSFFAA
jgi:hypothetical protein